MYLVYDKNGFLIERTLSLKAIKSLLPAQEISSLNRPQLSKQYHIITDDTRGRAIHYAFMILVYCIEHETLNPDSVLRIINTLRQLNDAE